MLGGIHIRYVCDLSLALSLCSFIMALVMFALSAFFALTLPLLAFVYAIPWNEVLFLAIVAYTVKHLCYSIFMLIGVTTNLSSIVNLYSSAPFRCACACKLPPSLITMR